VATLEHTASVYHVPPDVVTEELDGETILLRMDSGVYYGLDGVGTLIWRSLKTGASVATAIELVCALFPTVPAARIELDARNLLAELIAHGLLTEDLL
jgi:Coenzyme PQQ synthesis protein D (PqqD)